MSSSSSSSSSSTPTPFLTPSPFSDSNLEIPSTNYSHTMSIGTPETSPNTQVKEATIELHFQHWYKLYVQPLKDHPPVTMDEDYIVTPKLTYKFKVPLSLLTNPCIAGSLSLMCYVFRELHELPLNRSLVMYLKPLIVHNATELARTSPTTEFKVVFDVEIVKIDLADYEECEGYRRRGLVQRN